MRPISEMSERKHGKTTLHNFLKMLGIVSVCQKSVKNVPKSYSVKENTQSKSLNPTKAHALTRIYPEISNLFNDNMKHLTVVINRMYET